ncbi:MFS transporter [Demequina sp.]|uniref:MFS transporter n=1 Tax=Demequina sp. TaxID=2050685 RepID=UPI0025C10316|nr:MFS transporter [Demequina sp.]
MSTSSPSLFKQPKAVWAVAFAAVVAFMGIGLVDPILPAISEKLNASPTQAELLFTSYLLVTALAMFVSSWVSGKVGARTTLLAGLSLVVVFAALAGSSGTVNQVIGFRAGWGLGNALFISTALATIVGAASGGAEAAIVLYEAALGVGIAVGPLLGGLLGSISWRAPFFGTAVLMVVALTLIAVMMRADAVPRTPAKFSAPFTALKHVGLQRLAATALLYNIGFFTLLAYTPFPLGFGAIGLGLTFFGWGAAVAVTSVWVAPRLTRRYPRTRVLTVVFASLAVVLGTAAVVTSVPAALVVCVVSGGALLGVLNTVLTESVMEVSDAPRSVASSAYSSVRFLGGAIAPPLAAILADVVGPWLAYTVAAIAVLGSAWIVHSSRDVLSRVDGVSETSLEEAAAISVGDAG